MCIAHRGSRVLIDIQKVRNGTKQTAQTWCLARFWRMRGEKLACEDGQDGFPLICDLSTWPPALIGSSSRRCPTCSSLPSFVTFILAQVRSTCRHLLCWCLMGPLMSLPNAVTLWQLPLPQLCVSLCSALLFCSFMLQTTFSSVTVMVTLSSIIHTNPSKSTMGSLFVSAFPSPSQPSTDANCNMSQLMTTV